MQRLARLQAGVVPREQAQSLGVTSHVVARLLREGTWQPLARAIYLVYGATRAGSRCPGAGSSPEGITLDWAEASAYLHQIIRDPSSPIDVLTPNRAPIRVTGPWRFIREFPGARPSRSMGAPPRLTAATTILELGITRSPSELLTLIAEAEHRRLISAPELARIL